ncbi:MAG: FecR family protein [Bacteroidaceae bacterium]
MKKKLIPYKLLASYFQHTATDSEKELVRDWINKSPENNQIFQRMTIRWNAISNQQDTSSSIDLKSLWKRIQSKTDDISTMKQPIHQMLHFYHYISAAVLIGVVCTISIMTLLTNPSPTQQMVVQTQKGQKVMIVLPDSTNVWLNGNTSIVYSSDFNASNRSITLNGEAYFDVRHKSNHPFIVHTQAIDVVELGTAFNVNAYDNKPSVKVSLVRGELAIRSRFDDSLLGTLEPNESLIIQKDNLKSRKRTTDAKTISLWHLNMLRIDYFNQYQMWKSIASWYGVDIKVTNAPINKTYYFTVKTESLRELLNDVNTITPIDYQVDGETVIISYK